MLRYLNETYKKIIDDSIDGFFVVDRHYRIVQHNRSFFNMFGSLFPDISQARITDLLEGDLRKQMESRINAAVRRGTSETGEFEITNRSGLNRHYLVSLNPLYDEKSTVLGVFGFLKDITEQKRLQFMIENERNYNRSIIETVNLGFVLVDDQNEFLDYNSAYLWILGRDESELLGKTFYDFTVPRYREVQRTLMAEVKRTGEPVTFEKEFVHKNGSVVPVVVTMSRLLDKNGKPIGSFAFIKDISEQKRIERELIEKNERIIRLINIYNTVSARLLNPGAIREVYAIVAEAADEIISPATVEIFAWGRRGFRRVHTRGVEARKEAVFIKDDQSPLVKILLRDMNPQFIGNAREELSSKDLKCFPNLKKDASAIFIPVNISGIMAGFMVLSFDSVLPELDDIVLKLLNGIANLASITIEKLNSLREQSAMQQALDRYERLTAMGRIIAGVAHEINNPLSIIQFDLDDLRGMSVELGLSREYLEVLESIQEEIHRMSGIVTQLKDFSKPEEKGEEKVFIDDVIRSYPLKIVIKNMKKKGITVKSSLEAGGQFVKISRNRLIQVLMNLLNNADDAIPDKEKGVIEIDTRIIERDEPHLAVSIRDNGIGIDADDLSRIFEPFFTTKKSEGTGLGLSISYSIIKSYNGEIEVRSTKNAGSEFVVYLRAGE